MNKEVMFSSKTDMWATPQDFFDKLNEEFNFTLDAAAIQENAKCEKYFTPEDDGLAQNWEGIVWCNPPYCRQTGKWVKKAYEESQNGATVVMLLPCRPDVSWFHDYILGKAEIRFIRGRLKFGESKKEVVKSFEGKESYEDTVRGSAFYISAPQLLMIGNGGN